VPFFGSVLAVKHDPSFLTLGMGPMASAPAPFTVLPWRQTGALAPGAAAAMFVNGNLLMSSILALVPPEAKAIRLPPREAP